MPVASHGMSEQLGVERHGGEIVSPFQAGGPVALDFGLYHRDSAQTREARFAWETPGGCQPSHVMADGMATHHDAAVITVGCLEAAVNDGGGIVEVAPDFVVQAGLVILDGEQVVAATIKDGLGDLGLGAHGVDGDEGASEREAFEQKRDGGDLVGLGRACLLAKHQALAAGPGRDHVERTAVFAAIVRPSRGLAVDRHYLGGSRGSDRRPQAFDPGGEALREQPAIHGVDDIVQRVVARNASLEGQQATKKTLMHLPPAPDLNEILRPGQGAAQHQQKNLWQRKQNLPGLPRVLQRRKVLDQRSARHQETSLTRGLP